MSISFGRRLQDPDRSRAWNHHTCSAPQKSPYRFDSRRLTGHELSVRLFRRFTQLKIGYNERGRRSRDLGSRRGPSSRDGNCGCLGGGFGIPIGLRERVWWINARALRDFFRLRLAPDAEWEIRRIALMLYDIVIELTPSLFEDINIPQ